MRHRSLRARGHSLVVQVRGFGAVSPRICTPLAYDHDDRSEFR